MATQPTAVVVGNQRFYDAFKKSEDAQFFHDIHFVATLTGLQDVEVDGEHPTCYLFSAKVTNDLVENGYGDMTMAQVISMVPDPDEDVYGLVIADNKTVSEKLAEEAGIALMTPRRDVSTTVYEACGLGAPFAVKPQATLPKPRPEAFKPRKRTAPKADEPEVKDGQSGVEKSTASSVAPPKKKAPPKAAPAPEPAVEPVAESTGPIELPSLYEDVVAPSPEPAIVKSEQSRTISLPELDEDDNTEVEVAKPAKTPSAPAEPAQRPRAIALANQRAAEEENNRAARNAIVSRPTTNWGAKKRELRESADRVKAPVAGAAAWRESKRSMQGVVNEDSRRRWGTVIVLGARKGGVGKTTLAVNLAEFLGRYAPQGRKVCLVDMNSQQGDVSYYMGTDSPNIYSLVSQNYLLDDADRFSRIMVRSPSGNFDALLAPKNSLESGPDKVNSNLYSQAIDLLSEMYDIVVVDTPVGERWHAGMEFILKRANFILTPVTSSRTTVLGVKSWLDDITQPDSVEEGLGISSAHIGVILNRGRRNVGMDADEVTRIMTGYKVLAAIPDSPDWQFAENEGRILAEDLPDGLLNLFSYVAYHATSAYSYKDVGKKEAYRRDKKREANNSKPRSSGVKSGGGGGIGTMLKSWFKVG